MINHLEIFRKQIQEDIKNIQGNYLIQDRYINKDEYAFNYWVLSKIYNVDEEIIPQQITEYHDGAIDCWLHFPEDKEIFIIQNKYYTESSGFSAKEIDYFLSHPLTLLNNNKYTRSQELQNIFNQHKDDEEYKINLCFFVTQDKISEAIKATVEMFNKHQNDNNHKALVRAYLYSLSEIYNKYYGEMLIKQPPFSYELETINKGTFASIREEYGISDLKSEAYYIITPVIQIYNLYKQAEVKKYSLFEENIREFLGKNKINRGLIQTLEDNEEKKQFLYYNNGITLICAEVSNYGRDSKRIVKLRSPQIINGCQTTNSIVDVLDKLSAEERERQYSNVYVMLKVLVIPKGDNSFNDFYAKVVKYTNRQNAISDKSFAKRSDLFFRIQNELEKRGVLLLVKPSDKNTFTTRLKRKELKAELLKEKLNKIISPLDMEISENKDLLVDLEKLLQVCLAFIQGGYDAYTKKPDLLKKESTIFNNISTKIQNLITFDNLIRLFFLYQKAEKMRIKSADKRTPIPYYLIGFLGHFIQTEKNPASIETLLNKTFSERFNTIFTYLVNLTSYYRKMCEQNGVDFNKMLKQPIKEDFLLKSQEFLDMDSRFDNISSFLAVK